MGRAIVVVAIFAAYALFVCLFRFTESYWAAVAVYVGYIVSLVCMLWRLRNGGPISVVDLLASDPATRRRLARFSAIISVVSVSSILIVEGKLERGTSLFSYAFFLFMSLLIAQEWWLHLKAKPLEG
jgi:peptidoglycan biosynthesis protein MviN/MurJ (putative lipid II flippase)